MPILGYTQGAEVEVAWVGASTGHAAGNHVHFDLPEMPEAGILGTINFYLRYADNADQKVKFFIADTLGNTIWESAAFNQGADPSTTTADASAAGIPLNPGVRYKIGYLSESAQTNSRIIEKAGQSWWNDPGTWPTVNDPVTNVDPAIVYRETGEALLGHITYTVASAISTTRKGSAFDIETSLGTITTATLNGVNVFDHVTGQVGTTVSFAGAATDEITTSGEYDLVLGDGVGTETITLQVNVFGVIPSDNPLQKDGAPLDNLTDVEIRVTAGTALNGTELEYLPAETTDASGNISNIDLSSTAAADTDSVLLYIKTAAGDSIIAPETVELI